MNAEESKGDETALPGCRVLTAAAICQLDDKLAEAVRIGYATVELVVEKGVLRWIRGPTPSEPIRS